MKNFEKIAHITEEVLTDIRDGNQKITSEVINFMLDSLDRLKAIHQTIEETGSDDVEIEQDPVPETITNPKSQKINLKNQKTKNKSPKIKKAALGEKDEPEVSEEIVAEDGSWGLFTENLESIKEGDEIVAADGSWGLFPENLLEDANKTQQEKSKAGETNSAPAAEKKPVEPAKKKIKQKDAAKGWDKSESTIKVDVSLLDNLMNYVGELVLSRNQIMQYSERIEDSDFDNTCQRFNMVTNELQETVMKARLQPVGNIFNRFPRVVRDVTRKNGKKVDLKIEGENTELDKTILDAIRDPMTHMVRNAVDHGIETVETREKRGKDATGTLTLRAFHEGSQVIIEIEDDGAGIDPQKLRTKVIEKGLMTFEQVDALSDAEAIELVFLPGFSTAEKVTNISGRGVGMDVVKTNISNIGGRVEISSEINKGTKLKIYLPLTMSIIDGLQVEIQGECYVIPLSLVLECIELHREDLTNNRRSVANVRGEIVPYIKLREMFDLKDTSLVVEQMVITKVGDRRVGIIVDEVIGHYQTVIKNLGKVYQNVEGISGSTILGDGTVALILDIPKIIELTELEEEALVH